MVFLKKVWGIIWEWVEVNLSWLTDVLSYQNRGIVFWNRALGLAALFVVMLFLGRYALPALVHHYKCKKEGKLSANKRSSFFIKYFKRFFFQIVVAISLICLLFPIYCSGGYDGKETILFPMNFVRTLYHMLRFFVIEADIKETLEAINQAYNDANHEFCRFLYVTATCICCFLAPILTMTAIMSVFKNIRAHFNYFKSRGDVYIFSELNEKSAALADSLLEKTAFRKRPVIVFTDVLEPDSELQFDLQESAEEKGAICFHNDLESINYRRCRKYKKRKFTFYLMNDDETEKIRHATFISKNYDNRDVSIYVFSDKTSCKLFLSVSELFKEAHIIRIDEIQSLIYYNLHENGVRLFETAKKNHKRTQDNEKIVIRAIIIGFGRYGREMFKALLWFCQIPGYELDLHVIDNSSDLESHLIQEYPELMVKRKLPQDLPGDHLGDAQYSISASDESIDVNTKQFTEALRKIINPTYVFIALGNDEENIQTSIKVRELYQKMGSEPDIETVVYDANMADSMSYRWPLAGGMDAAKLIFQNEFVNSGYRASFSKLYLTLPDYFKKNLDTHINVAFNKARKNLKKIVEWGYDIDIQKLYERDDYLEKRHNPQFSPDNYPSEIIKVVPPHITENSNAFGKVELLNERCSASVTEKDNVVQIRVFFCFYTNDEAQEFKTGKMVGEDQENEVTEEAVDSKEKKFISYTVRKAIADAFDQAERDRSKRKGGVSNFKNQPYKIHMIGDLKNFYRHEIIINSNLIEKGQKVDERWSMTNRQNSKLAIHVYDQLSKLAKKEEIHPRSTPGTCEVFILKFKKKAVRKGDVGLPVTDLIFNFTPEDLKKKLHSYTVRTDDADPDNLIITDSKGNQADDKLAHEIIFHLFKQFQSDINSLKDHALKSRIENIENDFGATKITTYIDTKLRPFVADFIRNMEDVKEIQAKYDNRVIVLVNDEINNTFVDFSFPFRLDGTTCPQTKCYRCGKIQNGPGFNGKCEKQWQDLCNRIEYIHKISESAEESQKIAAVYESCDTCLYNSKCQQYNRRFLRVMKNAFGSTKLCAKLRCKRLKLVHEKCPHELNVLADFICSMQTQKEQCLSCHSCDLKCISYMRLKNMQNSMEIYNSSNYYKFEYNQRSSITKYMHEVLRFRLLRCGYIDDELRTAFADKNFYVFEQLREAKQGESAHKEFVRHMISAIEKDPINVASLEEQLVIGSMEHIRWNVYMRTEGYSFNIKRNDMAKQHNFLLPLHYLYLSDIRKDV